ncbi:G-D-S-L family lipolytic protein [Maribacter sp. MJ134]|uniref:GDSL-type esterase/lipase family protein n=1 Tax=Maribacter sp. MJ134 TaxID=2496865 RepID=UPI000F8283AC|nr:GDSL-type esterase/lipase family protein [Maribacter sp. MJ134]AZQ58729.1 G-D-S-L family lipolytic protein [Maribacter sp. MJ134]
MKKLLILYLFIATISHAQENIPFAEEVANIAMKYDTIWDSSKETIVFTGSSSVRLWKSLEESFPEHQIINTGFGGSQTSDLLLHLNSLVLKYKPVKVFIYEGDNDISAKKKLKEIIQTTNAIIQEIRNQNPFTQIILISAKPSISRWRLRGKYKRLNKKFQGLSKEDMYLSYVDVWNPMLDGRKLKKDIFITDGLHMNQKGYDIWYTAMKNLVTDLN